MSRRARKLVLTIHVVTSVGWLGVVVAFLVIAAVGLTIDDERVLLGMYRSTELLTWYAILPAAILSLVSGVVQGLGTPWGLFQHYWVTTKLVLTVLAMVVLLLQLEQIARLGDLPGGVLPTGGAQEIRESLVLHAAGGIVVLLGAAILSTYKPPGRTRRGQRIRAESRPTGRS